MQHKVIDVKDVVIRFSGDSGDGMQLTGSLFADASAYFGNEISTFPDYPAEIRAPQGTVAGVSGFQVHIGSSAIYTPGDYCDVLVAMNPAALKSNVKWLKPNATIIVDTDTFDEKGLEKAGFQTSDPFTELKIKNRNIIAAPITTLTKDCLNSCGLDPKAGLRCKNMFALGICFFLYNMPLKHTEEFFNKKFSRSPELIDMNNRVLRNGYNYAGNIQAIADTYIVKPSKQKPGLYRNINGNRAIAWGLMAASEKSGRPLFCGSYPITPATGILEELAIHKELGVKTLQCEDEIAGICTAIGASYAGSLAVTTTSGPGLSLKTEALGLAIMAELPLVIVDVQRAGPSTGIPTKTEQTDLNQALYGRNGESPVAVMAPHSPSHCFVTAFYAAKHAMEHMMPVIVLSEGFLGNGSEPWRIPDMKDYPSINPPIVHKLEPDEPYFYPFKRDPETMVPRWALPGTAGLEHRVGGLEKNHKGAVSSDPMVHQQMVEERARKVELLAREIPPVKVIGAEDGDILMVSWGGTYGHMLSAESHLRSQGIQVGLAHFDYINPLPLNTEEVLKRFKKIIVFELNSGHFANYLRTKFPQFTYLQYNKIQGQPFIIEEITEAINNLLK
ncbi:MAG: 2-oxoacid:acceptor oxidoreductase subunit alpha [Bacteroidales bacterium]|mgnify:FL=1|jgi:2-oxoglutarate ferredoxin oxidoreductase subunit alpha|nr:2-oxoacid:acceptor oxidoreductase subunit alpha [Bacteroidales bacterium]MDD2771204.1 2-oxoacid:acceptor oxidoreductase subunit alpha [Bacteroidales bacterium]MDD3104899.1 2-oxoacid:acceptor oxidoreductase subunit alpha [Bacteroidales bacterium]MDD3548970.1 2-oxoacid:acceptor oxidoreductase subunit alpha [Bacteroidales bacterium]MDD4064013.1 2-oxoacid:acceptor oxidoreductase subunit alpha [Bacteroidales bacterium]